MKGGGQVGFSQRVRLEWLDYTANAVLAGNGKDDIAAALRERLREALSVGNDPERGPREKAVTILTKVWVTVPEGLRPLRDERLDLLRRANADVRMLAHWCMCMAAYPFFGAVAAAAGRLLRLQGTAAAQVQRRLRERLGERETVARAARRPRRRNWRRAAPSRSSATASIRKSCSTSPRRRQPDPVRIDGRGITEDWRL